MDSQTQDGNGRIGISGYGWRALIPHRPEGPHPHRLDSPKHYFSWLTALLSFRATTEISHNLPQGLLVFLAPLQLRQVVAWLHSLFNRSCMCHVGKEQNISFPAFMVCIHKSCRQYSLKSKSSKYSGGACPPDHECPGLQIPCFPGPQVALSTSMLHAEAIGELVGHTLSFCKWHTMIAVQYTHCQYHHSKATVSNTYLELCSIDQSSTLITLVPSGILQQDRIVSRLCPGPSRRLGSNICQ